MFATVPPSSWVHPPMAKGSNLTCYLPGSASEPCPVSKHPTWIPSSNWKFEAQAQSQYLRYLGGTYRSLRFVRLQESAWQETVRTQDSGALPTVHSNSLTSCVHICAVRYPLLNSGIFRLLNLGMASSLNVTVCPKVSTQTICGLVRYSTRLRDYGTVP